MVQFGKFVSSAGLLLIPLCVYSQERALCPPCWLPCVVVISPALSTRQETPCSFISPQIALLMDRASMPPTPKVKNKTIYFLFCKT